LLLRKGVTIFPLRVILKLPPTTFEVTTLLTDAASAAITKPFRSQVPVKLVCSLADMTPFIVCEKLPPKFRSSFVIKNN